MYDVYQRPQSRLKTVLKMSWAILGIIVISAFILFFSLGMVGFLITVIGGAVAGHRAVPDWLQSTAFVLWMVLTIIVSGLIVVMSSCLDVFFAMIDWARGRTQVMVFA